MITGRKAIGLMGANIDQQFLAAGLVDEIRVHLVDVLPTHRTEPSAIMERGVALGSVPRRKEQNDDRSQDRNA